MLFRQKKILKRHWKTVLLAHMMFFSSLGLVWLTAQEASLARLYTTLYIGFCICLTLGLPLWVQWVQKKKRRSHYLFRGALSGWVMGVGTTVITLPLLLLAQYAAPLSEQPFTLQRAILESLFLLIFGALYSCIPGLFFGSLVGKDLWRKRRDL